MTTSPDSTLIETSAPARGQPGQPAASSHRHARFHLLKVAELERITDDAVAITFEVPEDLREEYRFEAGQHLSLRCTIAGDDVRRSYSICTPATSGKLRVGVKRLPGGVFSSYAMERLQVGDTLEVLTPSGRFTTRFDPAQAKHYGAVAAGSGITPILSILSTALEIEPGSRATLIYVNRTSTSVMFVEELEDLKNRYLDRLQLIYVFDGEPQEAELLSGFLDRDKLLALLNTLVTDDVDDWFLCGPLGLTDLVRDTLVERGVDPKHVHRELFIAAGAPARPAARPTPAREGTATGSAVSVILDGRTTTFTLTPGVESILDATLRLRGDAPYACKGGVCGTCRAKVLEGKVDMEQNYALEQDEVERGFVLTCQAHPISEKVVVDFDQ